MTSLHSNNGAPAKVDAFSLKVRVMIDQRDVALAAKKPHSNVIQFPSHAKRLEQQKVPQVYLEACQQLLNPVRHFFYDADSHYTLDVYLGELKSIEGLYLNEAQNKDQLNSEERQQLQVDVVTLQVAGFEHAHEVTPHIIAAHGNELAIRHLAANYIELAQASDVAFEVKKAYADVKGMIAQAKMMMNPIELPTLRRR